MASTEGFSCEYNGDVVTLVAESFDTEDKLLELASLAEAAERYSDMALLMKKLVETKLSSDKEQQKLDVNQRNLFSVAYKNVIGSIRSSWRTVSSDHISEVNAETIEAYKKAIENKMLMVCKEVLGLIEKKKGGLLKVWGDLKATEISSKEDDEARIFYMKMCGDYYRYLAEFAPTEEHKNEARDAYKSAMDLAEVSLPETHPTRLGLALNFSVCYYEIMKQPAEACELAKKAFDNAIEKLDTLNDASYKDSTLIMQLLRDNLTLWTSEGEDNQ